MTITGTARVFFILGDPVAQVRAREVELAQHDTVKARRQGFKLGFDRRRLIHPRSVAERCEVLTSSWPAS